MLISSIFKDKKILILGLGVTGQNIYRALIKSGSKIYVWDDNNLNTVAIQKNINIRSFKFNQLDYCVTSPGVITKGKDAHSIIRLLKKNRINVMSELDLFQIYLNSSKDYLNGNIKIIATTGTNGKSTVVSIIDHVLKKLDYSTSLIGNIGKSIFQSKVIKKGFYIIEVSSYQLETTSIFKPDFSIITNISRDHIERHKTLKEYVRQKFKIFKNQSSKDIAIISYDHNITKIFIKKLLFKQKSNLFLISGKNKNTFLYYNDVAIFRDKKIIYRSSNPYLHGQHNLENIATVLAFLHTTNNMSVKSIAAINSFKGLPHRQEIVRKINNTVFINDSKATNIESSIPALKSFKNIYWICGGIPKSKNMNSVLPYLKNVKKIYIIGFEKDIFFKTFNNYVETIYIKDMTKAVKSALLSSKKQKSTSTILLSPAAASFDQYKNFETRGATFKKLVANL